MSFGRCRPSCEEPVTRKDQPGQSPNLDQPWRREYDPRQRYGCEALPDYGNGRDVRRPEDNRGKSGNSQAYDRALAQNFDYTDKQLHEALTRASQDGKPVVMMFGSRNARDCQQMVDGVMRSAHHNFKDKATFIYVDVDTLDKNSFLSDYVKRHFKGGRGEEQYPVPTTLVFTQRQDERGKLQADLPTPLYGALDSRTYMQQLGQVLPNLVETQRSYVINLADRQLPASESPTIQPELIPPPRPVDEIKPPAPTGNVLQDKHAEIFTSLRQAGRTNDSQDQERLYRAAIAAADQVPPQAIMAEIVKLQNEYQAVVTGGGNQERLREIVQQAFSLKDLTQAAGFARANLGLAKIRQGLPAEGMSWILEAGSRNPEMYNDPSFARALLKAGYPPESTLALLEQGRANPNFYKQLDGRNNSPDQQLMQPDAVRPGGYSPGGFGPSPGFNPNQFRPGMPQPGPYNPNQFNPGYPQPGAYNPNQFRPGMPQPGAYNPNQFNPGYPQPGAYNPNQFNPGYPQPGAYNPNQFNPGYPQPGAYNPNQFNPGYPQPGAYNPNQFNPGYPQPGAYNPNQFRPGMPQPGAYNPNQFNPGYPQQRQISYPIPPALANRYQPRS